MLGEQATITVQGMDALVAWAGGDAAAADRLRKSEHEADGRKRELRKALSEAFSTPLEPEDIFELSRGLDEILNDAKNIVGEAEAMQTDPDSALERNEPHRVGLLGAPLPRFEPRFSGLRTRRAIAAERPPRQADGLGHEPPSRGLNPTPNHPELAGNGPRSVRLSWELR